MRTYAMLWLGGSLLANLSLSSVASATPSYGPVSLEVLDAPIEMKVEPVETPADIIERLEDGSVVNDVQFPFVEGDVEISAIINLGKQIWSVIENNRPVVNVTYDYANALPYGIQDMGMLAGFSNLQHKSYRVTGKNMFGMTVYDFTYTLVHQFGGSYNEKGAYLATVAVLPSEVSVMWGYTVNLKVKNVAATNVGTMAKPVASLALELNFTVSTVMKSQTLANLFLFRGDTSFVQSTASY